MNERVLVTGATGFIGQALVERLRAEGVEVIALDRRHGDIADDGTLTPFVTRGIGHVYHLAARTYVPDSWREPEAFFRTNVLGTTQVLEFCRMTGASLTYVSAYVYGQPERLPVDENCAPRAGNPYAESKLAAEALCAQFAQRHGLPVAILRPFNVYGPAQSPHFLIPSLVRQALAGDTVRVLDLAPRRDFVHVEDVIEALRLAAVRLPAFGIFNVASGSSVSVGGIVAILGGILGRCLMAIAEGPSRPDEIADTVGDASKAARELGWRPAIQFEQGLAQLVAAGRTTNVTP